MNLKNLLPMGEKPPNILGQGEDTTPTQTPIVLSFPNTFQILEELSVSLSALPRSTARSFIVIIFYGTGPPTLVAVDRIIIIDITCLSLPASGRVELCPQCHRYHASFPPSTNILLLMSLLPLPLTRLLSSTFLQPAFHLQLLVMEWCWQRLHYTRMPASTFSYHY